MSGKRRTPLRRWPLVWLGLWALGSLWGFFWNGPHNLPLTLHWGYDAFGRPLLPLTLHASSYSLAVALIATASTFISALFITLLTAFSPKPIRYFVRRGLEFWLAIPGLLVALGWAAVLGPGWLTLFASLLVWALPALTRLMLARAEEISRTDYVLSSRSLGSTSLQQARHHYLKALLSLGSVKIPGLFATALIAEATLSFMGVGAPLGVDTWGLLLAQGRDYLIEAPHIAWLTGIPLFLTVFALQQVSEDLFQSFPNSVRIKT